MKRNRKKDWRDKTMMFLVRNIDTVGMVFFCLFFSLIIFGILLFGGK